MRRFYFDLHLKNLYEVEVVTYGKGKDLFNIKVVRTIMSLPENKSIYKPNKLIINVPKNQLFMSIKKATEWLGNSVPVSLYLDKMVRV